MHHITISCPFLSIPVHSCPLVPLGQLPEVGGASLPKDSEEVSGADHSTAEDLLAPVEEISRP